MNSIDELTTYTSLIIEQLGMGKAVRIGESCIVSTKVHAVHPGSPGKVQVFTMQDAGEMFYGLEQKNQIVHMDLFHQLAHLNPTIIAQQVINDLNKISIRFKDTSISCLCNYMDLQTAVGGGKITGYLNYGKTKVLEKSHLNHVHLALKLSEKQYGLLFYVVQAVERGIGIQGVHLRKVQQIVHQNNRLNNEILPSGQDVTTDSNLTPHTNHSTVSSATEEQCRDKLIELLAITEDLHTVEQLLTYFLHPVGSYQAENTISKRFHEGNKAIKEMVKLDLLVKNRDIYSLTEKGQLMAEWLYRFKGELELDFNKLIPNMGRGTIGVARYNYSVSQGKKTIHHKRIRTVSSGNSHNWLSDLATVETVQNIVKNNLLENRKQWKLSRDDIMVYNKSSNYPIDICILIDGSISMSGKRIRAAKGFIRHLSNKRRDKISALVFQHDRVTSYLPFTRSSLQLRRFMNGIKAEGLTPLAAGLEKGLVLCQSSRLNNPLLVLITDGQPNIGLWTSRPTDDAIRIARKIKNTTVKFCCVGLQADKDFLQRLTKECGGTLYLVDEIEKDVLINILDRERVE